jgi:hypothetical protein
MTTLSVPFAYHLATHEFLSSACQARAPMSFQVALVRGLAIRVSALFIFTLGAIVSTLGAFYDVPKMAARCIREYHGGPSCFLLALGNYFRVTGIGIGKPLVSVVVPHAMFSGPNAHARLKGAMARMYSYFPGNLSEFERQCQMPSVHIENWRERFAEKLAQNLPRVCPRNMYRCDRADFSTFDLALFKPALVDLIQRQNSVPRVAERRDTIVSATQVAARHEMAPIAALETKPLDVGFHTCVFNAMTAAKAQLSEVGVFAPHEAMYKKDDIISMDATYAAVLDLAIYFIVQKCYIDEEGSVVLIDDNIALKFTPKHNIYNLYERLRALLVDWQKLEASDGATAFKLPALQGLLCHRTSEASSEFGDDVHALFTKIVEMRMEVLDQICMKSNLNREYPKMNLINVFE